MRKALKTIRQCFSRQNLSFNVYIVKIEKKLIFGHIFNFFADQRTAKIRGSDEANSPQCELDYSLAQVFCNSSIYVV